MIKKIILFGFLSLLGAMGFIYHKSTQTYQGDDIIFNIQKGAGFSKINQGLYEKKIIQDRRFFHYTAKYTNKMQSLKSGSYKIMKGMSYSDILDTFTKGESIGTSITIPEGKNIFEITQSLFDKKLIKDKKSFLSKLRNPNLVKKYKLKGQRLEGYLFPDTYNIPLGSSDDEIIDLFINNFKTRTKGIDFNKSHLSFFEVITLASVVEKETGAKVERKKIAGVFMNRLRKKMKLQSDPTIIYGMYEKYDGDIRKKDIRTHTEYNTYTIKALPIGPISNPGIESIKAVLSPESHDYLYFVSKNNGVHKFSKTYKEHLQAVKTWQLTKKNKKGRSWRDLKQ